MASSVPAVTPEGDAETIHSLVRAQVRPYVKHLHARVFEVESPYAPPDDRSAR